MENLSLHKAIYHKAYLINNENSSLCDLLIENDKHLYPVDNKDEVYLFDFDTNKIIEKFDHPNKINIDDYSPESLVISGIFTYTNTTIPLKPSLKSLRLEGGAYMAELMSTTEYSTKVWNDLFYELKLTSYNQTIEQRIEGEKRIRPYYNAIIPKLKLENPMLPIFYQIKELNLNYLEIDHIYLTDDVLKLLSEMPLLNELSLSYIFNDSVLKNKFPKNLNILSIYGSSIENLSDINLKGLSLEYLLLSGNTLQNIEGINQLKTLSHLNLNHNLINFINLNDLPKNIKLLSLDSNILENSFFEGINSSFKSETITELVLSNNSFIINPWLINRVSEMFPMLEHISLEGNDFDGIPYYILENEEEKSSMEKIKFWMNTQDYKHTIAYLDIKDSFNYYDNKDSIILKWQHDSLPNKLIVSDIQHRFSVLFDLMPQFKLYREGIYCDIIHDQISMVIREEKNNLYLEFYTQNFSVLNDYFYKYFEEIIGLIAQSTHHNILPTASFSANCEVFERFFKFIFKINKEILNNLIILPNNGVPMALIKTQKKGSLDEKKPKGYYKEIKQIAFIIVTTKESFPYIINEDFLISNIEKTKTKLASVKAIELKLRETKYKRDYIESLTNPYLGNDILQEAVIMVKNDPRYKMNILFNPKYFYVDADIIYRKTPEITMDVKSIIEPEIDVKEKSVKGERLNIGKKILLTFNKKNMLYLEKVAFSEPYSEPFED